MQADRYFLMTVEFAHPAQEFWAPYNFNVILSAKPVWPNMTTEALYLKSILQDVTSNYE